jgi:VanZ family protein
MLINYPKELITGWTGLFLHTPPASLPKEIFILSRTSSTSFLSPRSVKPALKRSLVVLRTWLPVLVFASIFAVESTAAFGADRTSAPLHSIFASVLGTSVDQDWSNTHHIIRKTGHFTGYGVFSLVCFRGFWLTMRNRIGQALSLGLGLGRQLICHLLAIATTFLVASADEFHQSFLPNRTGIFSDVILDTTGAFALQLVLFTTLLAIARWPKHSANQAQLEAR